MHVVDRAMLEYRSDYLFEEEQVTEDALRWEQILEGTIIECRDEFEAWDLLIRIGLIRKYHADCLKGIFSPEVTQSMFYYIANCPQQ